MPTSESLANAGLQAVTAPVLPAGASVIEVGANRAYTTIASALAASRDGDVLLVDAGTYVNDFAYVSTKVSIIGVGGMVNLVATVAPSNGKAILCVTTDCTMQNLSFSGGKVPDQNGAGIRYEGGNLTLRNCSFHDNENGLMSAPVADGTLLIQHCDFGHNGNGNGLTHNLYAGAIKQLIVEDSRFHGVVVGHEIKSRAVNTRITGNVIADGPDSTASYSIDLPNGGKATISGNLIEKGPNAENQSVIHFGGEGIPYAGSALRVSGNSIVNDRGPGTTGVLNHTAIPATITGNSFTRFDTGQVAYGPARETVNTDEVGTLLPDTTLSGILPGRTQFFTDADSHSVTFLGSDLAVQGGAGHLSVLATAGHVIALGGTGGMDFVEGPGSGGNQIGTAAGSSNTITIGGQDSVDSEGTDSITTGHGNVGAQVGGTATINEGNGNNQWSILGTATLTGHGGAPRINLGAGASVAVDGALAFMALSNNGGSARYDATVGGTRVQASLDGGAFDMWVGGDGRASITTAGGGPGVQMHMGAGDVQVVSRGRDAIWAGSGATVVQAWSGAEVHAGSGALALYSRGMSGAGLYGNGGTYVIGGDSGGVTYHGGDLDSTVQAELSNITLLGGGGRMTVQAGSRQTIVGGTGGLTLTEGEGSGGNHIVTLAGTTNRIAANADTVESWGQDAITVGAGNTTLAVHGTAVIQGGTGNNTLLVTGHATLAGQGGDWVTLTGGADATIQAGTYLSVHETAATLRVAVPGTPGTALVEGGSADLLVDTSRIMRVSTGAGTGVGLGTQVTVDGGVSVVDTYGADKVHTGSGASYVVLHGANAEVWAGAGQTEVSYWIGQDQQTVHGGAGSLHVRQNDGTFVYQGGSGDAVFDGAGTHLTLQGGAGAITLNRAYGGPVSFTGGTGAATLNLGNGGGDITFGQGRAEVSEWGWGDAVTYTAAAATRGTQVINGFRMGTDVLQLRGTGVASEVSRDGSTTLTTTDGAQIVLNGVSSHIEPTRLDAPAAGAGGVGDAGSVGTGLVLGISEDAWNGHALYTVTVDGQQVGGVRTASASHAQGGSEQIVLPGAHRIGVTFLNDAWGGTADTDRNLYVDAASQGGRAVQGAAQVLLRNGTATFDVVTPGSVAVDTGSDAGSRAGTGLVLGISEDAWNGDALYTVTVDGQQVGGVRTASASHAQGGSEQIVLPGVLTPGAHRIGVTFLNDAWGGTADTDRNLYVDAASQGGQAVQGAAQVLLRNGTATFDVVTPAPAAVQVAAQVAVGRATQTDGAAYAAPVAPLQQGAIWAGTDGTAASAPDVFLGGGAGGDAVLDASGAGVRGGAVGWDGDGDTFVIDGRDGRGWGTVAGFHQGDAVTVWGFQAGVSTAVWATDVGADGHQGAILSSELAGAGTGVSGSASFAGLTLADVQGKLTTTTGSVGGTPYLTIAYTG